MKSSILHIVLCYLILFSPISFVFNENLYKQDQERTELELFDTTDDASNDNSYHTFLAKVQASIQDEINDALQHSHQQSKKQAVYQQLKNLFHPTQSVNKAETSGNHFTAIDIAALHQRVFLISQHCQSDYLSYIEPIIVQDLHCLFEVYLI